MTLEDLNIRRRATARRGKEMGEHRDRATYSSNPQETRAAGCSGVTGLPNASGGQVHAWHLMSCRTSVLTFSLGTWALGATEPHEGRVLEA